VDHDFPVPLRALIVHPREHDLVIGTHGRAVYIIDDIRPLRGLTAETATKGLHLFSVPDGYQYRLSMFSKGYLTPGNMEFQGENRPYGAPWLMIQRQIRREGTIVGVGAG
jgi:hypothetical protein